MNIVEFYLDLAARDIALWTEDDKLRFRAPKGAMTQQIVAKIKANRPKIIAWLQNRAATTIPLSQAQRALWYVHQSAPSSPAYNLAFTLQLTANLDVAALEQAWQILLERHAVLRTTYVLEDEVPVGKIGVGTADFKQIDTAAWGTDQIEQWIAAEADRPFDLANGSVCRTHLLAGSVNHFVVVIHHIAVDFVAVQHLLSELETVYAALIAGQDVTLPPLDVTFHDYVRWEESKLSAENTNLTDYWQQKLAGELPTVNLTTDAPRPPVQTYNGAMCEFDLDAGLSQALRTLSQTNGVTPYMTLLAAFQVLLQRYTEQDDILIGSPMDIRGLAAFREVVGYYVNSVVLRADLADDPTFADLLKRVQQTALGAFKHQLHPFAQLVKQLQVQRDPSRSPLFQVSFVWDRFAAGTTEQGGLIEQVLTAGQRGASDDLAVTFYDKGISAERTFSGNLTYNTDLFDTATIERMAQQLQTLLASIVANPKLRVSELALLTETERQQILVEWNDTATDYPTDSCYHDLFAAQVERTPDEVAVVTHDGKQLTYRQLNEKANQVAHYLIKLGVTADAPVGIAIERSLEMVIGVLGILKAGGAYLPLDPNYPPERLQFMVQDARPTVLLTKTTQRAMVEKLTGTEMTVVQLDAEWEHIAQELRTNPTTAVAADNLSYIIYTSGSTGQPKGVMVSHRNQVNHNLAIVDIYGVTASDRVLQFATLNFDSAVEEIFPTLLVGGTLVLRDAASIITVADLHALTEREGITTYNFPTAYWHEWVSELTRTGGSVPSSLRLVAIGGEKALESRLEQWLTLVGNRVTLQNTYGPTEATVIASAFLATDSAENRRNFPIGKPIANTQLYILDAAMQPVPIGVAGELHIGGRGVARGYLNRSVLTAERFVRDPFSDDPAARLYRTGDRVRYRADGNIEFVGRTDNQIKLRGFRVELGEIEAALTAHAAVENAVVLLDEQQSNKRLIAYVAATIEASEVRTWLQSRLPSYMVPSGFVMLPALPRLPNGKINRKALVGMTEDVAVEKEASAEFEPQNETEAALVAVWSQVLNLDESDIGVHDNFFELGGDSILSIQIVSRALEVGVTVTPAAKAVYRRMVGVQLPNMEYVGVATEFTLPDLFEGI
ncbi:MAG: amino acid adenylation domain-containing protein, partial [Candidatus Promineifilaceae bacterium]